LEDGAVFWVDLVMIARLGQALARAREDLVWVEADGAADLVAGEFAGLPLVEDRPRRQAEEFTELAAGDEPLGHASAVRSSCSFWRLPLK
jgi:hypothetical protein